MTFSENLKADIAKLRAEEDKKRQEQVIFQYGDITVNGDLVKARPLEEILEERDIQQGLLDKPFTPIQIVAGVGAHPFMMLIEMCAPAIVGTLIGGVEVGKNIAFLGPAAALTCGIINENTERKISEATAKRNELDAMIVYKEGGLELVSDENRNNPAFAERLVKRQIPFAYSPA